MLRCVDLLLVQSSGSDPFITDVPLAKDCHFVNWKRGPCMVRFVPSASNLAPKQAIDALRAGLLVAVPTHFDWKTTTHIPPPYSEGVTRWSVKQRRDDDRAAVQLEGCCIHTIWWHAHR